MNDKQFEKVTLTDWFLINKGWILYSIISSIVFATVSFQQNCRQNSLEKRITNADINAEHRVQTAFAVGIGGTEKTNEVLEREVIERRTQLKQILLFLNEKQIQLPETLAVLPEMPQYESIAETRNKIKKEMIKTEENNEKEKQKEE